MATKDIYCPPKLYDVMRQVKMSMKDAFSSDVSIMSLTPTMSCNPCTNQSTG